MRTADLHDWVLGARAFVRLLTGVAMTGFTFPVAAEGHVDAIENVYNVPNFTYDGAPSDGREAALDAIGSLSPEVPRAVRAQGSANLTRHIYDLSSSFVVPGSLVDDVFVPCLRSFSADTEVLMADGTTAPISNIEVGDQVWSIDPVTGEAGKRTVTAVWPHQDTLLEFTVDGGTVTTTEDHHFWNHTDGQWQETQHIDEGDQLLTGEGRLVDAGVLG